MARLSRRVCELPVPSPITSPFNKLLVPRLRLIWLTWRSWTSLFPRNLFFQTVAALIGLFVVSVYLFSPIALALELSIRPEAIMAFVAFLQLSCITNYCKFRWHQPRPIASRHLWRSHLLAYALFVLKPNWLLALLATTFTSVPWRLWNTTVPLSLRLLAPGLGLLFVVITLLLPKKLLFIPTTDTRLVLPMTLFTIHADVIHENMKSELAGQTIQEERASFSRNSCLFLSRKCRPLGHMRYYPRLGFDPDYLMYRFCFPSWKTPAGCREGNRKLLSHQFSVCDLEPASRLCQKALHSARLLRFPRMMPHSFASVFTWGSSTNMCSPRCPHHSTRL